MGAPQSSAPSRRPPNSAAVRCVAKTHLTMASMIPSEEEISQVIDFASLNPVDDRDMVLIALKVRATPAEAVFVPSRPTLETTQLTDERPRTIIGMSKPSSCNISIMPH